MSGRDPDSATWWFRVALGDLEGARALVQDGTAPPRIALAFAQQAAEKALKAVIAFHGTDPQRTHDLVALANELHGRGLVIDDAIDLVALTDGLQAGRYPHPGEPDTDRADIAVLVAGAQSILDVVRDHLETSGIDLTGIEPA